MNTMNNILKMKIRKYAIPEYLFAILLVLSCRSVWAHLENIRVNYFILIATSVAAIMCSAIYGIKQKDIKKILSWLVLTTLYFGIYFVVNHNTIVTYLILYISVLTIGIYVIVARRKCRLRAMLSRYKDVMVFIALISLFFWLWGSVLHLIQTNTTLAVNWSWTGIAPVYNGYYGVCFEIQKDVFFGINIYRNTACFVEAPMASFHFFLALIIALFIEEKINIKNLIILIMAVVSTFSMTGLLGLVLVAFLSALNYKGRIWIIRYGKYILIPIVIAIIWNDLYQSITLKLSSDSGIVRLDDFVSGFNAWKSHPLFGCGYENYKYIQKFMSSWRSGGNIGFSNSICQIMAMGGLYFLIAYSVPFAKNFFTSKSDTRFRNFMICFLFCLLVTVVEFQPITILVLMIMFCGISSECKK